MITFFINGKLIFIIAPRCLPRNPLDCIVLCICVFVDLIVADELNENDSFYTNIVSRQSKFMKCFIILSEFLMKKSKHFLSSLKIEDIVLSYSQSRFPVKLIY